MCSHAETQCSVCQRCLDQSSNRIILEICGHKKCRECFIKEEDGCSICSQNNKQSSFENHINSQDERIPWSDDCVKTAGIQSQTTEIAEDELNIIKTAGNKSQTTEIAEDGLHIITTNENGDDMLYKCTICQKSFKSRNNRKYHLFCDKTRSKPFQCNQCDKQFITLAHMNYHQSTHNTNTQFSCAHCQKVYSGRIALKKHMKKHQSKKINKK